MSFVDVRPDEQSQIDAFVRAAIPVESR
jgi:hypothetical protein